MSLSFIETQFPVSKLSHESFSERTAKQSQTLTGLGKWWGRKPLVLCRASILGLLLPATNDPVKDRDVFLRLMTMDTDGLLRRKSKQISAIELFSRLGPMERSRHFEPGSSETSAKLRSGLKPEEKAALQKRVFLSLPYDERLEYCNRPEQIDGPSLESWKVINAHLGTHSSSLVELVAELGHSRFGHIPRVGDTFCGGGSIPFEAARLGCEAYGSDLNPVAAMLTWASVNIIGGGSKVAEQVREAQKTVYDAVERQVTEWGIEHREPDPKTGRHWRADAYLYCVEVTCPECHWKVPLAPNWVIGKGTNTVAFLIPDHNNRRYDFEIKQGANETALEAASLGTVKDTELICPHCKNHTPIKMIRGDGRGTFGDNKSLLRGWENSDVLPRENDILGERLYCVRWVDSWDDGNGNTYSERHYLAPTIQDLNRENTVLRLLMERFNDWQRKGFIPCRKIEPGSETTRLSRERGWTHWHHLFNPRQLLLNGMFASRIATLKERTPKLALLLLSGRLLDWDSRLCRWNSNGANEKSEQTFYNQALNTLFTFGTRGLLALDTTWLIKLASVTVSGKADIEPKDARIVDWQADIWITDPPYADAVNYEEVSEFFLAWYTGQIPLLFPDWYLDSKRALAVKGADDDFRQSMVECYRNLTLNMADNGLQMVMFTHQDASVWADLALILWAAGLRVTSAWCVATETSSGLKQGNYVQGTVLMVLRKQATSARAYLDEIYPEVESEVRRQLDSMLSLDDASDPNFADTDYQLAAYAAALRVLTSKKIEEIDVSYELTRIRARGEISPLEEVIRNAVTIACDHLVPKGIHRHLWKSLSALEKLYLKGLEIETHGECRVGVYQELARGFGVSEYKLLLASASANQARVKTASEFEKRELGTDGFGNSLLRHALFGIHKTLETDATRDAITWFTTEIPGYASNRGRLIEILQYLATLRQHGSMEHWHKGSEAAAILAGALHNRQDNL